MPPHGTTAERPGTPTAGMTRYNSDLGVVESYNGSIWVAHGASVFGTYFQESSADVDDSTTAVWAGSPTNPRVTITTPSLPVGKYRVGWSYNLYGSSTTVSAQARVQINNTSTIHAHLQEPKDASNNEQDTISGFYYYSGSGVVTIDLDYGPETAGTSVTIRRARLEFWRVS
jgi:hypothetical protein